MRLKGSRKNLFAVLQKAVQQYRHNYRTRKQLLLLDDRALSDIGITRAEALQEGRKPFWHGNGASQSARYIIARPAVGMFSSVVILSALTFKFW